MDILFGKNRNSRGEKKLQAAALRNDNLFEHLMDATKVCSLGQITEALFAVGGQYRRSM